MIQKIRSTDSSGATLLIRLMVGVVFVSEGIQKFLYPALRGAGRFEKIGLPEPEFLGAFVGAFEIVCGALVLFGLFTRMAAIPLLCIMAVAVFTTKGKVLAEAGFWEMMHGSRTDWSMIMGNLFLLYKGGGRFSVDYTLQSKASWK